MEPAQDARCDWEGAVQRVQAERLPRAASESSSYGPRWRFHDPISAARVRRSIFRLAREKDAFDVRRRLRQVFAGNTTIEEVLEATRANGLMRTR